LSLVLASTFWGIAALAKDDLRIGQRYEIVGQIYAYGIADDLNSRQLSWIDLSPLNLSGPEIISKQSVPAGSILTIIDRPPKRFLEFLYSDGYVVRISSFDAPAGIQLRFELCCGIQGNSTPLNPGIFKPVP
jgi:hypothetical protein